MLECVLEQRSYVLQEAYENDIHVNFVNANSDRELLNFVRAWGPPWIPFPTPEPMVISFALVRARQRELRSVVHALHAFKEGGDERGAFLELLEAEEELNRFPPIQEDEPMHFTILRSNLRIEGSLSEWAKSANLQQIQAATGLFVESILCGTMPLKLVFRCDGGRREVFAGWNFFELESAIRWMIWNDEYKAHPLLECPECRLIFRARGAGTEKQQRWCPGGKCRLKAKSRIRMKEKRKRERSEPVAEGKGNVGIPVQGQ
jgi:hypothetical protein